MVFCISKEAFASQFDIYLVLQCIFTTIQCFMFLLILYRQNTNFFFSLHFKQFFYKLEQLRKASNCFFLQRNVK